MAIETLRNNDIVEITGENNVIITSETHNPGFDFEKKTFNISGRVKRGKNTKIGTLSITAADNSKFVEKPSLIDFLTSRSIKSRLKIRLSNVTKDSNSNITGYLYDLIYMGLDDISRSKKLQYNLIEDTITIPTKETGIHRVDFGGSFIPSTGDKRLVKIRGVVGETFKIAINRITDSKDSVLGEDHLTNSTESSVLEQTNTDLTDHTLDDGQTVKIISGKIPQSGEYTFFQEFGYNEIGTSLTNRYSISVFCSTFSDKFDTTYWTKDRFNYTGWYSKILTKVIDPTLTLKTTTTSATVSIDTNGDDSFETFNSSTPITKAYKGRYGTLSSKLPKRAFAREFDVTHVIKTSHGSFGLKVGSGGEVTFTNSKGVEVKTNNTLGAPVFSNRVQTDSDWTNSVAIDNGGTRIRIQGISAVVSTTSSSNDTLTLKYTVLIDRWGTKDVTMTLDTDTIAVIS
jgi:hypothetical protein